MYLPKSKYSIKQASKGKFIYQISKKAFEGEYILLSDGDMFAGNKTLNIKGDTKIIPITKEKKDNTYILHNERNNNYFNNLLKTKRISKFQDNLTPIINTKPTHVVFSHLAAGDIDENFLTIQIWGDQEIPYWVIKEEEVINFFTQNGYDLTNKSISEDITKNTLWKTFTDLPVKKQIESTISLSFKIRVD